MDGFCESIQVGTRRQYKNDKKQMEDKMMNYEKYLEAFVEAFGVTREEAVEMKYGDNGVWDSAAHMILISTLEDQFDIMFDTEEIIDFNSFAKGLELLKEKYNVEF